MAKAEEILCPYCCRRFGADNVHFRLNYPIEDETDNSAEKKNDGNEQENGRQYSRWL